MDSAESLQRINAVNIDPIYRLNGETVSREVYMAAVLYPRTDCEAEVIRKIRERKALGMQKYGVSVSASKQTHREFLQHAQDEAMDLAIYLQRLMDDLERGQCADG